MEEIKRYDQDEYYRDVTEKENGDYVKFKDIETIIEENRKMKQMLRELEYLDYEHSSECFVCHFCGKTSIHKPTCELAKLIEGKND